MKMHYFVLALIGLVAVDVVSSVCLPCTNATGGAVCAKTNDGKLKQFANLCEMNRLNCINNREGNGYFTNAHLDFSAYLSGPCPTSSSTAVEKAGNAKAFMMPGAVQFGPRCGNCVGTATNAVCGKNSQGRMLTFINSCWLQLNNCYYPSLAYTVASNGYCKTGGTPVTVGATPAAPGTGINGVASHPNIGLINSAECGKIPVSGKILNGQDAGLFQYPWAAYLSVNEPAINKKYACGGSIISSRYVLTAAHCVSGFGTPLTITVLVGDYTLSTSSDCGYVQGRWTCAVPAQWVTVEKVIVHPSYNNNTNFGNDITLLRLSRALDFSTASVKPVCLPVGTTEETRLFNGEMLTVVGWGVMAGGRAADTLQAANVLGVSAQTCAATYGSNSRIYDSQLCAGGNSRDSCSGDSGSPLMYTNLAGNKMTEYGVVSYGVVCGSGNIPGVYTKVGYFMKWILDTMSA